MLNPEGMNMAIPVPVKYGVRTIVKYVLTGNAPAATIDEVSPANGSTLEKLSHFVFTFSYYAGHTDNADIQPRLHIEGSEELIALEQTIVKEDGSSIGMQQAALKTVEPVYVNGTYILEIPKGYFCDGNGKEIEGITLKYTVKNDGSHESGIEDILTDSQNGWTVYTVNGIMLFRTSDAARINTLPAGIYIVNGVKTLIK